MMVNFGYILKPNSVQWCSGSHIGHKTKYVVIGAINVDVVAVSIYGRFMDPL